MALPEEAARIVVAVSGGADSLALWLALDELRGAGRLDAVLTVAHFNHGLREESADDALWVAALAERLGYAREVGTGDARSRGGNLEQEARRARYAFLQGVAENMGANYLLTAHTLDDQAETVLLHLMRGAGPDGLGGIKPLRPLSSAHHAALTPPVWLARPLLRWARRAETVEYCRARGVIPLADAMNEDENFSRVRVRRQVLPLLESFNPRIVTSLGRTAELLQADAIVLQEAAAALLQKAQGETSSGTGPARVDILRAAPEALRLRALRLWLKRGRGDLRRLELTHLRAVERLLEGSHGRRIAQLPGGARVERRRGWLLFHASE